MADVARYRAACFDAADDDKEAKMIKKMILRPYSAITGGTVKLTFSDETRKPI
jgi:hypothetical protein